MQNKNQLTYSILKGADQMQAICLAVKTALTQPYFTAYIFLWLPLESLCKTTLTLNPHSNATIIRDTHTLISAYLQSEYHMFHLYRLDQKWPGKPSRDKLRSLDPKLDSISHEPLNPSLLSLK